MKKIIILFVLTVLLLTPLAAKQKSAAKAMLFSALVPGSGQAYLGSYTKAGIFLASEIITLGAALRLSEEVKWAENSYEQYALAYNDIPLGSDKTLYQNMQNYISSADYNYQMQEAAWSYFVLYYNDLDSYYAYVEENSLPDEVSWDWGTVENWQTYNDKRRYRQDMKTYSNLAVAVVVLNHLVGIIDTALTNAALKKGMKIPGRVYVNPDIQRKGLGIGYAFNF